MDLADSQRLALSAGTNNVAQISAGLVLWYLVAGMTAGSADQRCEDTTAADTVKKIKGSSRKRDRKYCANGWCRGFGLHHV